MSDEEIEKIQANNKTEEWSATASKPKHALSCASIHGENQNQRQELLFLYAYLLLCDSFVALPFAGSFLCSLFV